MMCRRVLGVAGILALTFCAAPAFANQTYFFNTQNGAVPGASFYGTVDVVQVDAHTITFTLHDNPAYPGGLSGFDAFGFNYSGSASLTITAPPNWNPPNNNQLDGFGVFDFVRGGNPQDALQDPVLTVTSASVIAEADFENKLTNQGWLFGAHFLTNVNNPSSGFTGFVAAGPGDFGPGPNPVPAPPSALMAVFGMGALGLYGLRRRICSR